MDKQGARKVWSQRRRDAAAGLFAAAAHVALLVLTVRFGGDAPPVSPLHQDDVPSVMEVFSLHQVELLPEPVPSAAPGPEAEPPSRARAGGTALRREPLPDLPPTPGPEAPAPAASAAPAEPHSEYSEAPAVPVLGDPLALGTPAWAVPGVLPAGPDLPGAPRPGGSGAPRAQGPLAPRVAAAPGATVLRDTLRAADRDLGLGNPGATTIRNEVEGAVLASAVPNESSAVLVAHIGADGSLTSLVVQQLGSGDARTWSAVASAASAALGKRKLRLAGLGPKGAVVRIVVRSTMAYPSGSTEKVKGILPSLTDGPPRDVMPAPSPDGDSCAPERWTPTKPLCGVGMKIASGDVTDLVSGKKRSVRASAHVTLLDGNGAPAAPPATPGPASAAPSAAPAAPGSSADVGAP